MIVRYLTLTLACLALTIGARAGHQEQVDSTLPPAYESALVAAPLEIDLDVLETVVRPLDLPQAEEQLARWRALLQRKCFEVRDVELALLDTEDADEISKLNERNVTLRAERAALIECLELVLDLVESKGGDVAEARDYVGSVYASPAVSGWRSARSVAVAWLVSPEGGVALGWSVLRALAVLVATWILAALLSRLTHGALERLHRTSGLLRTFVQTAVRRLILLLGLLVAATQLGFSVTPLVAAIGAAGLVVGLALQGTLGNIASGIMIMVYRPFDVDDVISTAGKLGTVEGLTLVTTRIRTPDNQIVHVPNNKVWGDVITNLTASDTRRVDLTVGIAYDEDVQRAMEVLEEVLRAHEKVLDDPAPLVRVHELADSSVNLVVRPWVATSDYWEVYWDVTKAIKQRLDQERITIPFPQRDVHLIPAGPAPAAARDVVVPQQKDASGDRPAVSAERPGPG